KGESARRAPPASRPACRSGKSRRPRGRPRRTGRAPRPGAAGSRGRSCFRLLDDEGVDAPAVGAQHLELEAGDGERLAAARQAAEVRDDEAADRVVLLVGELRAEGAVEVGDLRERLDAEAAARLGQDVVARLVEVVLVLDVADDLFQ